MKRECDEKYLELRAKLKEEHAIICPIRANDYLLGGFDTPDKTDYGWLLKGADDARKIAQIADPDNRWRALKAASEIVGYFVARLPHGEKHVKFGSSICKLHDLDNFTKIEGIELASEKGWALPRTLSEAMEIEREGLPLSPWHWVGLKSNPKKLSRFVDLDQSGDTLLVRLWPISLEEQFIRFQERCRRYFKKTL